MPEMTAGPQGYDLTLADPPQPMPPSADHPMTTPATPKAATPRPIISTPAYWSATPCPHLPTPPSCRHHRLRHGMRRAWARRRTSPSPRSRSYGDRLWRLSQFVAVSSWPDTLTAPSSIATLRVLHPHRQSASRDEPSLRHGSAPAPRGSLYPSMLLVTDGAGSPPCATATTAAPTPRTSRAHPAYVFWRLSSLPVPAPATHRSRALRRRPCDAAFYPRCWCRVKGLRRAVPWRVRRAAPVHCWCPGWWSSSPRLSGRLPPG